MVRRTRALLLLLLLSTPAAAQSALPPLPRLTPNQDPAPMRDAVARAYASATARATDVEAVGALARLLHAWELWDGAHEAYTRAAALQPGEMAWHYLDGCVLQRIARQADAAAQFQAALAIADYLPARVKLAEALLESGRLTESANVFTSLLSTPAVVPHANFGLGRVAAANGKHDDAIPYFERAITLYPQWGAAHYALALSLRATGRRADAERALERHAEYGARWPAVEDRLLDDVAAVRDDAAALVARGSKAAGGGDLPAAIALYERAIERDPSFALAHANLVKLYGRTGEWPKAESQYRAAIALGSNLPELHYDYGVLLGLQQQWDRAGEAYERAIAVDPMYAEAHNNLGQIRERARQFDLALDEYRRAVTSQPTLRLARFNVGRMLIALGRPSEAIPELDKLREPRDAESPPYLFALAVAHMQSGHRDEGVKWANEAKRLALEFDQKELAAAIDRQLASLK